MAKEVMTQIKLQIPAGKGESRSSCGTFVGAAWGEYYGILQAV